MSGLLSTLVRTLRERALLSQEELADRSGLSVSTIRGVESGRIRLPRGASVRRIMDAIQPSGQDQRRLLDAYHARAEERVEQRRRLIGLDPQLRDGEYVFVTVANGPAEHQVEPVMSFAECEGRTLVVSREQAEAAGMVGARTCAWITLQTDPSRRVAGSLEKIASALAEEGISCSTVSAYHHDHLFVPAARAWDAVEVLRRLGDVAEVSGSRHDPDDEGRKG